MAQIFSQYLILANVSKIIKMNMRRLLKITTVFSQTVTRTTENDSSRQHETVKQYDASKAIHSEKLWAILASASKLIETKLRGLSIIAVFFECLEGKTLAYVKVKVNKMTKVVIAVIFALQRLL